MNPRAAINDLHPFQGCPFNLLGTSPNGVDFSTYITVKIFIFNGEGGIRTHAPLRTNGFQDRLVMTTSIPLQDALRFVSARIILTEVFLGVNNFFKIFLSFFIY